MKYIVETEFIGHERHIDVEDDTPVMGASRETVKKHIKHGPYKTKRGAKNAFKFRKEHWRKKGFRHPPKRASLYDPHGNYMFKHHLSDMDEKTRDKKLKEGYFTQPDHITFSIEERVVSKEKVKSIVRNATVKT